MKPLGRALQNTGSISVRATASISGKTLVILLGGGAKKGQSADIQLARQRWQAYKARKKR